MIFEDREEAARMLASRLEAYRGRNPLVLGIPRGGVVMAARIAEELNGEVDVVLVRKLRAPNQPEFALGSIDETGRIYLSEAAGHLGVGQSYLDEEASRQLELMRNRRAQYTPVRAPTSPSGRITIVVDDGLATGSTMIAALRTTRLRNPEKLVAATAVAPEETLDRVKELADEVVCLDVPAMFFAVGQAFKDFAQVEDEEVIEVLSRFRRGEAA